MNSRRSVTRPRPRVGGRLTAFALLGCVAAGAIAADTGDLRIVSQPGVTVTWEGVSLGETDAEGVIDIAGIPLGAYEVRLSRTGFQPRGAVVEVRAGLSVVSLALTPSPPASRERAPATSAPPPVTAAPPVPAIEAEPAPEPEPGPEPEPITGLPSPAPAEPASKPLPPEGPRGRGWLPTAVVALAILGALALVAMRLRGPRAIPLHVPPRAAPEASRGRSARSSDRDDLAGLREEVRRREQDLERAGPKARRLRPDVIDVDDFEVIEENR